jgi:hypothetical protein
MNCQNPFKISDIDINKVFFRNIKESENKKIIFIKYNENNKLKNMVFQFPTLLNEIEIEENKIEITIKSENDINTTKIINLLDEIDNKIISEAKKNANIWFDHIEDKSKINYHHSLRKINDLNSIKLKIIESCDFKTNLILNDNESNNINLNDIPENGKIKLVLECYAIWINNNTFGLIYRPVIISFILDEEYKYNYKILNNSESDISENNYEIFIKTLQIENNLNKLNDSDSDSNKHSDSDSNKHSDSDSNKHSDSDSDSDSNKHSDSDSNKHSDSDSDSDSNSDHLNNTEINENKDNKIIKIFNSSNLISTTDSDNSDDENLKNKNIFEQFNLKTIF